MAATGLGWGEKYWGLGEHQALGCTGSVVPRLSLSPLAVLALSCLTCLWLMLNPSDILK